MLRKFIFPALGIIASACTLQAQQLANDVLVGVDLPGESAFIKWTNLRNDGSDIIPHSQSTIKTGDIEVLSPGFRGSLQGFYAFGGDFGYTAAVYDSPFAIKNVVFQSATMYNPTSGQSVSGYFNYKHTDYYQPGDESTMTPGGTGNYGYSEALGALDALVAGYTGGPVLTWTDVFGNVGSLTADYVAHLNDPLTVDGSAHGTAGTYYNFAWQWDLSALPNDIISVEITVPLLPHSSTIGSQINISDSFGNIIPEPTTYALLVSVALCGIVMLRRRNRK